ncbi:MAG: tetratricopeptide repeat protein, partial [Bacteroidia bacterium]
MSTNFDFKQIEKELYNFKDYYINEPDLLKRIENCNVKLANYLALNKLIEEDVTISKSDYSILCVKICEIMSDLLGTELKKFSLAIKNPINKLELNHNQKSLDTITNILWSFYRFSYNTSYTHSLLYPKLLGSLHSDAISTNQDLKNKLAQDFIFSTEMELDPTSLKLFHLGFFILNSASIRINPKSFVFNGACDFHNEYFLDFEAIYQLNYNAAASIFDKVFKKNPKFIEAEILRESALLKYSMFEYTDDTRDENIENLELIVKKFPNNAFAHIELAYAYTSISADTEAMQHINSALHICSHSAYLYYRAATMLYRVSRDVQQSKEMILK